LQDRAQTIEEKLDGDQQRDLFFGDAGRLVVRRLDVIDAYTDRAPMGSILVNSATKQSRPNCKGNSAIVITCADYMRRGGDGQVGG
jgi:hypothetical protein